MPCGRKYVRIRAKDVGRPGYHYILLGIKKKKGPRGGKTERIGGLKLYKNWRKNKRKKKKNKK